MPASPARTPLRIGVIGGGVMGTSHARFLAAEEGAVLAGVADPYTGELARDHGVPYFTDHRELLAQPGLDAVVVASPNAAHVGTAVDCVRAGLPVLLEKPVATSAAEAGTLLAAQAEQAAPVLVGHHRRHHPAVRAARSLLREGGLGKLLGVNGVWLTRKPEGYFAQAWRREKGAGVVLINLVHDLDLMRHLCGEITAVQARTSNAARGHEVEDTACLTLTFESGALGSFLISDSVVAPWGWDQATEDDPAFPYRPGNSCYTFSGTSGSLSFPDLAHHYHQGTSDWNQPLSTRYLPRGSGDSYTGQLRHFLDVARGEAEPLVTVADAARTLAVAEAVHTAAGSGAAEPVPPVASPVP